MKAAVWKIMKAMVAGKPLIFAVAPGMDPVKALKATPAWARAEKTLGGGAKVAYSAVGSANSAVKAELAVQGAINAFNAALPHGWNDVTVGPGIYPTRIAGSIGNHPVGPKAIGAAIREPGGGRPGALGKAIDLIDYVVTKVDAEYVGVEYAYASVLPERLGGRKCGDWKAAYGSCIGFILNAIKDIEEVVVDNSMGDPELMETAVKSMDASWASIADWMDPTREDLQATIMDEALGICNALIAERNAIKAAVSGEPPIAWATMEDADRVAMAVKQNRTRLKEQCPLFSEDDAVIPYLRSAELPLWWVDWERKQVLPPVVHLPCKQCAMKVLCHQ